MKTILNTLKRMRNGETAYMKASDELCKRVKENKIVFTLYDNELNKAEYNNFNYIREKYFENTTKINNILRDILVIELGKEPFEYMISNDFEYTIDIKNKSMMILKNTKLNMNILQKLKNLKEGETLFIKINEDLSNTVKYYDMKFKSYDNLFMSYINNTCEDANKFNLEKFMDKYIKSKIEVSNVIQESIRNALGKEAYEHLLKNKFNYGVDYNLNVISINKPIQIKRNLQQSVSCNNNCKGGVK